MFGWCAQELNSEVMSLILRVIFLAWSTVEIHAQLPKGKSAAACQTHKNIILGLSGLSMSPVRKSKRQCCFDLNQTLSPTISPTIAIAPTIAKLVQIGSIPQIAGTCQLL